MSGQTGTQGTQRFDLLCTNSHDKVPQISRFLLGVCIVYFHDFPIRVIINRPFINILIVVSWLQMQAVKVGSICKVGSAKIRPPFGAPTERPKNKTPGLWGGGGMGLRNALMARDPPVFCSTRLLLRDP